MKQLTQKEADKILKQFIILRNKLKKNKDPIIQKQFREIQELCIIKFNYLIDARTKRYKSFSNYDDLQQDGRIALLSALNNYDPRKGNFFWWANQYIKTKISREANRHSTIRIPIKKAKIEQPFKVSKMPVLYDAEPNSLEKLETEQQKKKISEALSRLPDNQQKILELNGIRSHSISHISRELNISRTDCLKLLNRAKKNLKRYLENIDI